MHPLLLRCSNLSATCGAQRVQGQGSSWPCAWAVLSPRAALAALRSPSCAGALAPGWRWSRPGRWSAARACRGTPAQSRPCRASCLHCTAGCRRPAQSPAPAGQHGRCGQAAAAEAPAPACPKKQLLRGQTCGCASVFCASFCPSFGCPSCAAGIPFCAGVRPTCARGNGSARSLGRASPAGPAPRGPAVPARPSSGMPTRQQGPGPPWPLPLDAGRLQKLPDSLLTAWRRCCLSLVCAPF